MNKPHVPWLRVLSGITAALGVLIIMLATMISHDRYRQKLIQQPQRVHSGVLEAAVNLPRHIQDATLLLEIRIETVDSDSDAHVSLNGAAIGRIGGSGHRFIKLRRAAFLAAGNTLAIQGLAADSIVSMLEIKNVYGFSTGLLQGVLIPSDSTSVKRLPPWLALPLAFLLLLLPLVAPHTMSLAAKSRLPRFGAAALTVLLFVGLALPVFFSVRLFFGLPALVVLLAGLYWPGLRRLAGCLAAWCRSRLLPWVKLKLLRLDFSPREWKILGALALAAIFVFFAAHRQRFVGASDWYGYYAESQLFRQGRLTMPSTYPPDQYSAFAPLGFNAVGSRIIPQYPPGFPLLMALFGLIGLEFYVSALVGTLTVLLIYLILRESLSRGVSLLFAALWLFFPITMYISVRIMSDLAATLFILLAYYLFNRDKTFWSGVAFSYAVAVRPSSVLFFLVFLPLLLKAKKFWRFCFSAAIVGSLYGIYNWLVFGKPWTTGYGKFSDELLGSVFFHHFVYYGKTILILMTPLLLIPALLAVMRRKPRSWFYLAWLAAFWVFYSFWKSGADSWWYLRFLLPGLPALFILAAIGTQEIRDQFMAWKPRWQKLPPAAAVLMLLLLLPYFIDFSHRNWVFSADKGEMYYLSCKKTQTLVPADAMVGGLEMSGPIKLYTDFESFRWDLPGSVTLIRDFLKKGRPLYLLIEPWNKQHPAILQIAEIFSLSHVAIMPDPMGTHLSRLALREE